MKKAEIKKGVRYRTSEYGPRRCAEVVGDPQPHPYKQRRSQWDVVFPYVTDKDGELAKGKLEADEFLHEWSETDQKLVENDIQDEADTESAQNMLNELGFDSATIRISGGGTSVFMSVSGKDAADKLIEYLSMGKVASETHSNA
jgi:hypothetical protein